MENSRVSGVVYWIISHLGYGSGSVSLEEIHYRYAETVTNAASCNTFGKIFSRLFPDITPNLTPHRGAESRKRLYKGIIWIHPRTIHIQNVGTLLQAQGYQVVQGDDFSVGVVSSPVKFKVFETTKELRVRETGSYQISVDSKKVPLEYLGLPSQIPLTESAITTFAILVKRMKFCHGNVGGKLSTQVLQEECLLAENQELISSVRANNCYRLRTLLAFRDAACRNCQEKKYNVKTYQQRLTRVAARREAAALSSGAEVEHSYSTGEGKEARSDHRKRKKSQTATRRSHIKAIQEHMSALNVRPEMSAFILDQLKNSTREGKARRWDNQVLLPCLQLFCQTPANYSKLEGTDMLVLPSARLMQQSRSLVGRNPGFQDQNFEIMRKSALDKQIPPTGFRGGLIFEEISVCPEPQSTNKARDATHSHIVQLLFHGYTDFVFPVAFFTADTVDAACLLSIFVEAITKLKQFGFCPDYIRCTGSPASRSFLRLMLGATPLSRGMRYDLGHSIVHMVDPSKVLLSLRNLCFSSGTGPGFGYCLMVDGSPVVWTHWEQAYNWDQSNQEAETQRQHPELNKDCIELTDVSMTRCEIAAKALDNRMLDLVDSYARSTENHSGLLGTINFLTQSSRIVSLLSSTEAITSLTDQRLVLIPEVFTFFESWVCEEDSMPAKTRDQVLFFLGAYSSLAELLVTQNEQFYPSSLRGDAVSAFLRQHNVLFTDSSAKPSVGEYAQSMNSILVGALSGTSRKRPNKVKLSSKLKFTKKSR